MPSSLVSSLFLSCPGPGTVGRLEWKTNSLPLQFAACSMERQGQVGTYKDRNLAKSSSTQAPPTLSASHHQSPYCMVDNFLRVQISANWGKNRLLEIFVNNYSETQFCNYSTSLSKRCLGIRKSQFLLIFLEHFERVEKQTQDEPNNRSSDLMLNKILCQILPSPPMEGGFQKQVPKLTSEAYKFLLYPQQLSNYVLQKFNFHFTMGYSNSGQREGATAHRFHLSSVRTAKFAWGSTTWFTRTLIPCNVHMRFTAYAFSIPDLECKFLQFKFLYIAPSS